jgi:hypothetical protein
VSILTSAFGNSPADLIEAVHRIVHFHFLLLFQTICLHRNVDAAVTMMEKNKKVICDGSQMHQRRASIPDAAHPAVRAHVRCRSPVIVAPTCVAKNTDHAVATAHAQFSI